LNAAPSACHRFRQPLYDHHKRNLQSTLTDLQHDNCLEVLVVRGASSTIKRMANALLAAKGVKHGRFTITSIGRDLSG